MATGTAMVARSDAQVKADVLKELKWDTTVSETEVGVQVKDGIVTLTGNVDAYPKRMAARNAAHRVIGVLDVVDELKVRIPTVWERTDEDIAKAVRNALKWDVLVPDDRITTTVSNGTVMLQGSVTTWQQRADAERAITRLTGVRTVTNQLSVTASTLDPAKIKSEIEKALERQAERESRRIAVSVQDGTVTLTGTVRSWGERSAVEQAASFAPGVQRIEDRTVVDPYQ